MLIKYADLGLFCLVAWKGFQPYQCQSVKYQSGQSDRQPYVRKMFLKSLLHLALFFLACTFPLLLSTDEDGGSQFVSVICQVVFL